MAGTFSGFQSHAVTHLNYANPVQLNDSSNNRLSAERWLFVWGSLVFRGIWMAQALAQAIHGSLWKQRDNLFVRRLFHAWLQRCWESLKTFRPPLLRFFRERLRYWALCVFLLLAGGVTQSSKGCKVESSFLSLLLLLRPLLKAPYFSAFSVVSQTEFGGLQRLRAGTSANIEQRND